MLQEVSCGQHEHCQEDQTDPFIGYKITNWEILEELNERSPCPSCNKSRKYFCYTCYVPVPLLRDHIPKVKLPIKVDIIKHAKEIDGKSTAVHAAVLAPDDVKIYTYPCIPNYSEEEKVVLLFPGKGARTIPEHVEEYRKRLSESEDGEPVRKMPHLSYEKINNIGITRAIFIDSTWNQSRGIYKDQRLRSLPCIVLQSRISQFWRHQHGSPRWFLATIEAVHQFLVELSIHCGHATPINQVSPQDRIKDGLSVKVSPTLQSVKSSENSKNDNADVCVEKKAENPEKPPSKFVKKLALCRGSGSGDDVCLLGPEEWKDRYDGRYDNLLFFFRFMYSKIHQMYDPQTLRSYRRPMV